MSKSGTRAAHGSGTIRKKTVTRKGQTYTYWEARVTVGRDPGTGRQIQRSFTGQTQREVREKMQAAAVAVNEGTYRDPVKLTVGEWLDIWVEEYLRSLKPASVTVYKNNVKNHIKPAMAAVKLAKLQPHTVQRFINGLDGLSASSVRLAYKVLHQAMEKAVQLGYLPKNPASGAELPRVDQKEIKPLEDHQAAALLAAAKGGMMEQLVTVALFTGCRQSELLGLTWDCVDFDRGTLTINKQLTRPDHRAAGLFISPKNGKARILTPAPSVLAALKERKRLQAEARLKAGPTWEDGAGLVFTTETGAPLEQWRANQRFSSLVRKAGLEGVRFHDLRHTYAVNALRAGDDIKSVQGNLGHATAAFTLDRYAHFTEQMKQASADRMETFIKTALSM